MYKKQRPKLSVSAVINSAQNPSMSWFNGTNGNCPTGLANSTNAPTTRKFALIKPFAYQTNRPLCPPQTATNIDFSANGINYTPNPTTFSQMSTNGSSSIGSLTQFNHQNSTESNSSNTPKYPPNHPLSGSKHLCAICGDRASGRHYGLYR